MADPAHEWTDGEIAKLSRRLHANYNRAYKEMSKRYKAVMAKHAERDAEWRRRVAAGEATRAEYQEWKKAQAADQRWYDEMRRSLASQLSTCDQQAAAMVNGAAPGVFAENFNYGTYQVESGACIDTSFTLADQDAVTVLLKDRPDLLPQVKGREAKQQRWAQRKITSAITQSVLCGDSVPRAAARLRSVVDMDGRAAVRAARTALTGAENSGRIGAYQRAKGLGIGLKKQWMATLDGRTRDSHRQLDGESVEVEEKFSNGLMYPGDPDGPAAEVWNCRCTLVADVDGAGTSEMPRPSEAVDVDDPEAYALWKAGKAGQAAAAKRAGANGWEIDPSAPVYHGMSEKNIEKIEGFVSGAEKRFSRVWKKHEGGFSQTLDQETDGDEILEKYGRDNVGEYKSFYSAYYDEVVIGRKHAFDGSEGRAIGDTWFHEFGHNIDYLHGDKVLNDDGTEKVWQGSGRPQVRQAFSKAWRGGAFPDSVKQEASDHIKHVRDTKVKSWIDQKLEVGKLIRSDDQDEFERGQNALYDLRYRGMLDAKDYFDYQDGKLTDDGLRKKVFRSRKSRDAAARRLVEDEIMELPEKAQVSISDMYDGATRGKCRASFGHGAGYWDEEDKALATESFAEMTAAAFTSDENIGYIKQWFPKSWELFEEMYDELGKS